MGGLNFIAYGARSRDAHYAATIWRKPKEGDKYTNEVSIGQLKAYARDNYGLKVGNNSNYKN